MNVDLNKYYRCDDENPLENPVTDGGFVSVFRKIAVVGDSLASGELEAWDIGSPRTYHDYFDISWGQYIARLAGTTVYNFSRGGMTASEYCNSFADAMGYWNTDKAAQCYIIALGVNDLFGLNQEIGSVADIDRDWHMNKATFCGYYARIIQHYKEIQPDAKFFLVTMPSYENPEDKKIGHRKLLYDLAEYFTNTYVVDLHQYGPVYDEEFRRKFFVGGHMNSAGYLLTARLITTYIDYIIRHNMDDFSQIGFVGTGFKYCQQ